MKILKASFKGYKGLKKVSVGDEYKITIEDRTNIHSISGENGMGKSTLVSNLNPFIFPNGYTGKSTSDFINYPGHKKIEFLLDGCEYKSVIKFNSKTSTKGTLQIRVGDGWRVVEGYESSKATTYTDLIEKFFGASQKNITMVNYIGQNTNAIIESNPKARRELITPLIGSLEEHNEVISRYDQKEKTQKEVILEFKGVVSGLVDKIGSIDVESLPTDNDIAKIKIKIELNEDQIEQNTVRGKKLRGKQGELNKINLAIVGIESMMSEIKKNDTHSSFPEQIKIKTCSKNTVELRLELENVLSDNNRKEQNRINIEKKLSIMKEKYDSSLIFNENLLGKYSEDEIYEFNLLEEKLRLKISGLESDKIELEKLKKEQLKYEKNSEIITQIATLKKQIICIDEGDVDYGKKIMEINEQIYDVSRSVDEKVGTFVDQILTNLESDKDVEYIKKIYLDIFGLPVKASEEWKKSKIAELEDLKQKLEAKKEGVAKNKVNAENIVGLNNRLHGTVINQSKEITKLADKIEKKISVVGTMMGKNHLVEARKTYMENKETISNYVPVCDKLRDEIKENISVDISGINKLIEVATENEEITKVNSLRERYKALVGDKNKCVKENELVGSLSEIDKALAECENKHNEYRTTNQEYQKELVSFNVGYQKRLDADDTNKRLTSAKSSLDEAVMDGKVYNAIKNYTKNIKETIISMFMVNITNLANQYLAMDENSSININLSIEQKGPNFNINAKQDGSDMQEVSTLSGAEKSTVNRALATAIAFSKEDSKYGNYCFDEADSALSQSNKLAFSKNIKDIAEHDMVEQLFIISHDNGITDYLDANKIQLEAVK